MGRVGGRERERNRETGTRPPSFDGVTLHGDVSPGVWIFAYRDWFVVVVGLWSVRLYNIRVYPRDRE